ncbi:MAG: alkaline phosphatase family protein [Firmicutes bacterium]|nr:alkaline phosphatase family protein [Bacillota bacterium]
MTKKNKLLVFCVDALCASDIEFLRSTPHFGKILKNGALVEKVLPVFPALTYPCHTSILTGTYVNRHGIAHNEILKRGGKKDVVWHNMKEDVKAETLLDLAREEGLTTCSLSWPVSGAADYDFNMPMIVPIDYQGYQPERWLRGTATDNLMERYFHKHGRYLKGPDRSLDLFTMALALDILEDFEQPDVMLVKMCDLDSVRHTYGVYHQKTKDQLLKHDQELGAIMECLRRKGTLENTNLAVLGDHGQTDIRDALLLNVLLEKNGFLKTDESGKIISFDAFSRSAGLSALIEVRDPQDEDLMARVREFLETLRSDAEIQLSLVMDAAEAEEAHGLAGNFDFIVESALPIAFDENTKGDSIWGTLQPGDHKVGAASHGGSPEREEVTTFFASGPSIKKATVTNPRPMVDLAPTLAQILGFRMDGADGTVIEEIIKRA